MKDKLFENWRKFINEECKPGKKFDGQTGERCPDETAGCRPGAKFNGITGKPCPGEREDEDDPELAKIKQQGVEDQKRFATKKKRMDLAIAAAKSGKSPAEMILAQYPETGGDPNKLPPKLKKFYDIVAGAEKEHKQDAAVARKEIAAAKEEIAQIAKQKATNKAAYFNLMDKAELFTKATQFLYQDYQKKHKQLQANQEYEKAATLAKRQLQIGDAQLLAVKAGFKDQGKSWDPFIKKAQELGFKG